MTALIAAEGLSVTHGGPLPVLRDVSLSIHPGEILTIVGPNGSGKSTLIGAMLGLVQPSNGRVRRAPGLRIGYVPQSLALDPTMPMTVRRFLSLPKRVSDATATAALARTGVAGLEKRAISNLSGGQLQRVLLARALINAPQLLVLDEPTQGLDQPGIIAFYNLVEDVRRETGAAILLVSHDLLVVMRASDRVICLNGHVCCEGSPAEVSSAPAYRALFGPTSDGALALYRHQHDHSHDRLPGDTAHDCAAEGPEGPKGHRHA